MKIAVPTRDGCVDNHFGHCDHYTIFNIENNAIVERYDYPSPQGCGCKSGIAPILAKEGVEVMLAGSMGDGAMRVLSQSGIRVVRGCAGDVDALVRSFLLGVVFDSGNACDHHDCPSGHDHH